MDVRPVRSYCNSTLLFWMWGPTQIVDKDCKCSKCSNGKHQQHLAMKQRRHTLDTAATCDWCAPSTALVAAWSVDSAASSTVLTALPI